MPTIVLQIEKESRLLYTKSVEDEKIAKESIEKLVMESTGLSYQQYDVFYIDAENDSIMTVVEEDYSIAEMTLESDSILFHIEVKVDQDKIKFPEVLQEKQQQQEFKRQSQYSQEDVSEQEKAEQVYKSAISQEVAHQVPAALQEEKKEQQHVQEVSEEVKPQQQPSSSAKVQQQEAEQQKPPQNVEEEERAQQQQVCSSLSERYSQQNGYQQVPPTNQTQKVEQVHCDKKKQFERILDQPQFWDLLFEKVAPRLQKILKPQCFLAKDKIKEDLQQSKKEEQCKNCKEKIIKIPFYINKKSQYICQTCELTYQSNEILLKVRSQASRAEILATRYVTISNSELQAEDQLFFQKESDPKLRQKRISELLSQKIKLQSRQSEQGLYYQ